MPNVPFDPKSVTRREAILKVSALLGGTALVGQSAWLSGCAPAGNATRQPGAEPLSPADVALLDEVADTILPPTGTPGAKAAGVGPFMAVMVRDAYDPREQRAFVRGIGALERACVKMHGAGFMSATPAQRLALVVELDREQFDVMQKRPNMTPPHYFRMIKELTLLGYFTSEVGYTLAMRYAEVPGRFDPCVPYAPGDRAWAPHA
jgi:hypothetical protein